MNRGSIRGSGSHNRRVATSCGGNIRACAMEEMGRHIDGFTVCEVVPVLQFRVMPSHPEVRGIC